MKGDVTIASGFPQLDYKHVSFLNEDVILGVECRERKMLSSSKQTSSSGGEKKNKPQNTTDGDLDSQNFSEIL